MTNLVGVADRVGECARVTHRVGVTGSDNSRRSDQSFRGDKESNKPCRNTPYLVWRRDRICRRSLITNQMWHAGNNNNNEYLERLTHTCPKRLHVLCK